MMSELKPCPFCGGEALLLGSYERGYFVECNDCFAKTSNFGSEGKAESIVAWNTRAERTCKRVDVDGYSFRFECSTCGYVTLVHNCETRLDELPNYCPNCGAKVVDR